MNLEVKTTPWGVDSQVSVQEDDMSIQYRIDELNREQNKLRKELQIKKLTPYVGKFFKRKYSDSSYTYFAVHTLITVDHPRLTGDRFDVEQGNLEYFEGDKSIGGWMLESKDTKEISEEEYYDAFIAALNYNYRKTLK